LPATASREAVRDKGKNAVSGSGQGASVPRADVNAKDQNGQTALTYAAVQGDADSVKALVAAGADLNAQDNSGQTALMNAAMGGHLDCVKALIAAGADVAMCNKVGGQTALMVAPMSGNVDCVKALIAAGADVNARTHEGGRTVLMLAARGSNVDCVKALIAAGADLNARDDAGNTALGYAQDHPDTVAALQSPPNQLPERPAAPSQADASEAETKQHKIRQDQPMIFEVGVVVPEGGRYECKTCGVTNLAAGLFGALSSLKQDTNPGNFQGQLQAKLKESGIVRVFQHGEAFTECPRCGRLTAWQLLENIGSGAENADAVGQKSGSPAMLEEPLPLPVSSPLTATERLDLGLRGLGLEGGPKGPDGRIDESRIVALDPERQRAKPEESPGKKMTASQELKANPPAETYGLFDVAKLTELAGAKKCLMCGAAMQKSGSGFSLACSSGHEEIHYFAFDSSYATNSKEVVDALAGRGCRVQKVEGREQWNIFIH
jgi:hypothetical protein